MNLIVVALISVIVIFLLGNIYVTVPVGNMTTTTVPTTTTTMLSGCQLSSGPISGPSFLCNADKCVLTLSNMYVNGAVNQGGVRVISGLNSISLVQSTIIHPGDTGDSYTLLGPVQMNLKKGDIANVECTLCYRGDYSFSWCGQYDKSKCPSDYGAKSTIGVTYGLSFSNTCNNQGQFSEYLRENSFYDYSSPEIQSIINSIKSTSSSQSEMIDKATKRVKVDMGFCVGKTCFNHALDSASQISKLSDGYCVTKSRLLIAILRGLEIPARGVSGRLCNGIDHAWVEYWDGDSWNAIETTPYNTCYNRWGECGDGKFTGKADNDMLDNKCFSQTLFRELPCNDWAKECAWVADTWT